MTPPQLLSYNEAIENAKAAKAAGNTLGIPADVKLEYHFRPNPGQKCIDAVFQCSSSAYIKSVAIFGIPFIICLP